MSLVYHWQIQLHHCKDNFVKNRAITYTYKKIGKEVGGYLNQSEEMGFNNELLNITTYYNLFLDLVCVGPNVLIPMPVKQRSMY